MKKLYEKIINFFVIIWIYPFFRYPTILFLLAVIYGLIKGTSPLYNIF